MLRADANPARSAKEWCVNGTLAILVAVFAYLGIAESLASYLRSKVPEQAYVLAPWDGRMTATLAQALSGPDGSPAERKLGSRYARDALGQDATSATAASTLAINAQIDGNYSRAKKLALYAQQISRRDLAAQLWLIEDAVSQGNVSGALNHYDIALRTSASSRNLLFPVLVAAAANRDIRVPLARTLASRPPWASLFIEYAAANSSNPASVATLLRDLMSTGYPVSAIAQMVMVDTLLSRGLFDDAWHFYQMARKGAERNGSRDQNFTADLTNRTALDWRVINDGGASATIQRGMLDFSAPSSVGGDLIEQFQLLAAGDYVIAGHSSNVDQEAGASPYWKLTCSDGREIGRVDVTNSMVNGGSFSGVVTVPKRCPMQKITLVARPSYSQSNVVGQIDRIMISEKGQ